MTFAYKAFISYSQAADGKLAPALHSALHRIGKPWYRLRVMRLFRDKASLSANPALWPAIATALTESEYFILMASPMAARSKWVNKEVEWWISNRSANTLLLVLTDGEILWDEKRNDFDWSKTSSLPSSLAGFFENEPLYADLRWARKVEHLSLRHARFRMATLDLAATLLGWPKDDLDGEDVRQFRRTRVVSVIAVTLVLTFAVLAAWEAYIAIQQRKAAERQTTRAVAQKLAAQAEMKFSESERYIELSALLALESMTRIPFLEADHTLRKALSLLPKTISTISVNQPLFFTFGPKGNHLIVANSQGVHTFDVTTQKFVSCLVYPHDFSVVRLSDDGSLVAIAGDASLVRVYGVAEGVEIFQYAADTAVEDLSFSEDGRFLLIGEVDGTVAVLHTTGVKKTRFALKDRIEKVTISSNGGYIGAETFRGVSVFDSSVNNILLHIDLNGGERVTGIVFSANDEYFAISIDRWSFQKPIVRIFNTSTGREVSSFRHTQSASYLEFSPDGNYLAIATVHDVALGSAVHLVETATGAEVRRLEGSISVNFSPNGRLLVAGTGATVILGEPGIARIFEVNTGKEIARLTLPQGEASQVRFNSTSRTVAIRSYDEIIRLYEIPDRVDIVISSPDRDTLWRPRFSSSGKYVFAGGEYGDVHVFELDYTSRLAIHVTQVKMEKRDKVSSNISALALGCNDQHMAVRSSSRAASESLIVRDIIAKRDLWHVSLKGDIVDAYVSDDCRFVTAVTETVLLHWEDGTVAGRDSDVAHRKMKEEQPISGSRIYDFYLFSNGIADSIDFVQNPVNFSKVKVTPDSKYLAASGSVHEIKVFSIEYEKEISRFGSGGNGGAMAISADGTKVAIASGTTHYANSISVFDVATGRKSHQISYRRDNSISDIVFSNDGKELSVLFLDWDEYNRTGIS